MLRAVTYSRFSSDQQNSRSAGDQTRACRLYAESQGWVVVGSYEDHAISGASAQRPEFQRLERDAGARAFDVVVTEALDRLGRKLADIARLHDRLSFLGIAIHTVQQGAVTPMHIGLLGTMSQLFLADLKAKTRRGLRAVAEDGRSAGGVSYGYRSAPAMEGRRGGREIVEPEATVVRRIFRDYAHGVSPRAIAAGLNAEGVAGPRGGRWSPSAINGDRRKGTGILNNELYVGRQVWGRQSWIKHPETGRRLARRAEAADRVVTEVPALRIVEEDLWQAAKDRQAALDRRGEQATVPAGPTTQDAFWSKQRPRYLFSGLMRCAACGGGFSKISASHFGCSTARNQGAAACTNRLTIRRDALEDTVLNALRTRLMNPELFRAFVAEFTATWNRLQAEASAGLARRRQELARLEGQIARAVDAILDGQASPALKQRLDQMERRKAELEQELAGMQAPAPRLHPNLAEVYRQRVTELSAALVGDAGAEARELIRGLVEEIRLVPEGAQLRIEVRGELASMLRLAEGARNDESPSGVSDGLRLFAASAEGDAGTRKHLGLLTIG